MKSLRADRSGVALLVTLLVLVLIVTLALEIFRIGARAAQTGAYGRDSVRAVLLAEGGVAGAKAVLKYDFRNSQIDTLDEIWGKLPPQDFGEGTVQVFVEDEERKINLNNLTTAALGTPGWKANDPWPEIFRRLLVTLEIEPSLADAVVDWLDTDEIARSGGVESAYYQSLPFPYRAKNDKFDTVEELRLVRGVTPEVFEKLKPFVTVRSSGKVNINTAPAEVLMALSAAATAGTIDRAAADQVIAHRQVNPFKAVSEFKNVGTLQIQVYNSDARFQNALAVASTTFHVRSTGLVSGTARTIDALGEKAGNDIQWRFWRLE